MKTTSASAVTDLRSLAIGGCFALLALLLSLAASAVATHQGVENDIARTSARAAAAATAPEPLRIETARSFAGIESNRAFR